MKLRIDLKKFNGDKGHVQYSTFKVGNKSDKYLLTVGGFKGSLGMSKYLTISIWNAYVLYHLETEKKYFKINCRHHFYMNKFKYE